MAEIRNVNSTPIVHPRPVVDPTRELIAGAASTGSANILSGDALAVVGRTVRFEPWEIGDKSAYSLNIPSGKPQEGANRAAQAVLPVFARNRPDAPPPANISWHK